MVEVGVVAVAAAATAAEGTEAAAVADTEEAAEGVAAATSALGIGELEGGGVRRVFAAHARISEGCNKI